MSGRAVARDSSVTVRTQPSPSTESYWKVAPAAKISCSVDCSAGVRSMPASRSGCPQSLSPTRNSNGWPFCQPMAICSTKCRSSRRISAGTSTTRRTRGVTSSISTLNRAISFMFAGGAPLFRGLLKRQHLVARSEVDDLSVLDHASEVLGVLQDRDVGDRVLVPNGDVGKLPRGDLSDLAVEADRHGVVARCRDDRFHRRVAAVLDEDFELLGVQFAVAGERIVAGVGADQKPDAELARLVHQLAEQ